MKNFIKKHKNKIIRVISMGIKIIPVLTIFLLNHDVFVDRSDKTINAFLILILMFVAMVFKDNFKKFFVKPTGFKTALILSIVSYIMVTFGEPVLQLSLWFLASTAVALPLDMWVNAIEKPKDKTDSLISAIESLKETLTGGSPDAE